MNKDHLKNIENHYTTKIYRAFGNVDPASRALGVISTSLVDIYRYFEPSFFNGNLYIIKHFSDSPILNESEGSIIQFSHEKNMLLNRTSGILIIQVFENEKMVVWENKDTSALLNRNDALVYHFYNNKERFLAYKESIDLTENPEGSMYATQFYSLKQALKEYAVKKIYNSSCDRFNTSWTPNQNRIFFQGGGRGNNIPEKYMQESLNSFLDSFISRGITIDTNREFNTVAGNPKPKPVDIAIYWKRDNRLALVEIKFLGTVKGLDGNVSYTHDDRRANEGIVQLKGYFDSARTDLPTTIIGSYLVVIDGRRNNLSNATTSVSHADGMHYKDIEIIIDNDKQFHESIPGFEKPIKMFATPICN